ncbi:hypothetical protein COC69_29410 [Bacillus cereus]|uniref:Uncharacterized protein n=1 Tax=Bacillus cereus TaxID=1396 RepID=A0A9X7CHP9_BACCE|nr:hypothetical protein [Bacillus cereus]PGS65384.1 hypothetical protein COC69_29410 [Bacillus cereus]
MNKYQIIYTLFSPDGTQDMVNPIIMYATTESIIKQRLDKELQRRLGDLYQWEIAIQHAEDEQLLLFETT